MIFVTAQPDELQFAWQMEVQLKRLKELNVDLKSVYVLVGLKSETTDRWDRIKKNYPEVNLEFFKDERESSIYPSSIRPFLLGKFFTKYENLVEEYMYYADSDTVFVELPAFEAMQDYRWHVSKSDYISWNYINEKNSPSLMKDMLDSVGIPEEVVKEKGQNVGGVQYFIYGTTPEFWQKVEQDCERMFITNKNNWKTYSEEFKQVAGRDMVSDDFQIWCTDMWCIYWNALLFGVDVYVNPEMSFIWPKDKYEDLDKFTIYHDSGINGGKDDETFFRKANYIARSPFNKDLSKLGYYQNGEKGAQRFYLDIIESISDQKVEVKEKELPLVSCLMTTYGRFECVERSIKFWLLQDYPNKELIILNTANVPLSLDENLQKERIFIVNKSTLTGTDIPYNNVGQIRSDILNYANGKYYICWDDDDLYLPFHIYKGMQYLEKTGKKAYMPKRSYYSPDGGNTFEYASNSMEAACIVDIAEIKQYGFINSNGGEHVAWRRGLVDEGELDENIDVYPFESYVYLWGEEIASHKQSGSIDNPNNFENHKAASTDFGSRPLSLYSPVRIRLWFDKIIKFANHPNLNEYMKKYL